MENIIEGILPYDYPFSSGYQKDRKDGHSPIARTNLLRNNFLNGEFRIHSQRALLVTEADKMYDGQPIVLKRANILKYVLENLDTHIYDDELIVGTHGAPNKYAAVYPEFSYDWVIQEMEHAPFEDRDFDNMLIDDQTKAELRSIADYWEGRTVKDEIVRAMDFDHTKASNLGNGTYFLNLYMLGGIGHFVCNFERLLEDGFVGTIEKLQADLVNYEVGSDEHNTIQAMIITNEGALAYIKNYFEAYVKLANDETDPAKKSILTAIANNLKVIYEGAPQNIWQAMQIIHVNYMVTLIESNGHSISYGRYDQYLYPFYKNDIENNTFSKPFVQELIEAHFIKMGVPTKLRDGVTAFANTGRGFAGESVTVGGVDKDGNDVTNELTMMCIDASAHTRMMVPWLCVRLHENTPEYLKIKTFSVVKAGFGHPKVFNDKATIEAQMRAGRTLEDARQYAVVGCVEPTIPGREFAWADAAYFNNAKILEYAINDGKPFFPIEQDMVEPGERVGLATGDLTTFNSIEEVKEAYLKQQAYFIQLMAETIGNMEAAHAKCVPTPFISTYFDNCVKTAKDMTVGGCEFNHTGPQGSGIATVADALVAIDQFMFEQKKYTGQQLMEAMQNNWKGYERAYALTNSSKMPHYGNDDDYADEFACFVFDNYCAEIEKYTNARGGTYKPGVYGVSSNVIFGMLTGPSLDGRKVGEPISDNMGPAHTEGGSHDTEGPTAVAKSVSKLDHARAGNGTLLNWKFNPTSVSGKTGTENLISLMDTYFDRKGMHSQFNIMSSETMKDAFENPDNYRDMLVRVAGYSAYFVELSVPLQLDLIARTELSFE